MWVMCATVSTKFSFAEKEHHLIFFKAEYGEYVYTHHKYVHQGIKFPLFSQKYIRH